MMQGEKERSRKLAEFSDASYAKPSFSSVYAANLDIKKSQKDIATIFKMILYMKFGFQQD